MNRAPQLPYDSESNTEVYEFLNNLEITHKIYQGNTSGQLLRTFTTTYDVNRLPDVRTTTLEDGTQSQVDTDYDSEGRLTEVRAHDWGQPGPVVRTTQYEYMPEPYPSNGLAGLIKKVMVRDGDGTGVVKSRTDFGYDEHALTECPTGGVQHDDALLCGWPSRRGNRTSITRFEDPAGSGGLVWGNTFNEEDDGWFIDDVIVTDTLTDPAEVTIDINDSLEIKEDFDLDNVGAICDCNSNDESAWELPGDVRDLVLDHIGGVGGTSTLSWSAPAFLGGTAVLYDVRTTTPMDFIGPASCIESDDGSDTEARDATTLSPGELLAFLVRRRAQLRIRPHRSNDRRHTTHRNPLRLETGASAGAGCPGGLRAQRPLADGIASPADVTATGDLKCRHLRQGADIFGWQDVI